MGTQLPPKGHKFSAHVCCGQTAQWIKMPLGTEVGLGPGHIVLDGTQLPLPRKVHNSLLFSAHVAHLSYCCALVLNAGRVDIRHFASTTHGWFVNTGVQNDACSRAVSTAQSALCLTI